LVSIKKQLCKFPLISVEQTFDDLRIFNSIAAASELYLQIYWGLLWVQCQDIQLLIKQMLLCYS